MLSKKRGGLCHGKRYKTFSLLPNVLFKKYSIKLKDYCVWNTVAPSLFAQTDWTDRVVEIMKAAKTMVDFVNAVIDDYE